MDGNYQECKSHHHIVVENFKEGEILTYSLVLIKGKINDGTKNRNEDIAPKCFSNHVIVNNSSKDTTTYWPVLKTKFKCLIELTNGQNEISLKFCSACIEISLQYTPRSTEYFVTPIYLICKNHNGNFQAPIHYNNSIEHACRRIILGTKLIQSLIAEKLYENNFGRKTFQIESDVICNADDCVRFYSNLTVEEARSMDQEALWVYFGREIMKSNLCSNKRKFLAFLSATWWDGSENGKIEAHAALGGGGLALFGTGCLYTWPERVEDVITCFLDTTPVDTRLLMDDSCFRGTYGGCFSTTLGSVCHELGHTFDLGHSKDGIMGRGFDNIDLVFLPLSHYFQNRQQFIRYITVQLISKLNVECIITTPTTTMTSTTITDASSSSCSSVLSSSSLQPADLINENNQISSEPWNSRNIVPNNSNSKNCTCSSRITQSIQGSSGNVSNENDKTYWSASCATLLAYHRWFNSETVQTLKKQDLKYDNIRGVVMSSAGIRVVELRGENGLVLHSWQFTTSRIKHQLVVPLQVAGRAELIVIEDSYGNILKQELKMNTHLNH